MKFIKGILEGVYLIELEPIHDERGFFSRVFCEEEFKNHGLDMKVSQCNISLNKKAGTFRGMHYQGAPHEEKKIVSCFKGSIHDIILDIRENSKTYGKWETFTLSEDIPRSLYIPEGFAHGFQTMEYNTIVHYTMSVPFSKDHSRTIPYTKFNITLPRKITAISDKDKP